MLIVLTQDQEIINWCNQQSSGAGLWGQLHFVNAGGAPGASVQLRSLLSQVDAHENLCITGHGNDKEVGDAESSGSQSWVWDAPELAGLLGDNLPAGYSGSILMEVCCKSITSFAANLAESLRQKGKLEKVWIYGYTKSIDVQHKFPDPAHLDKNVELNGHLC